MYKEIIIPKSAKYSIDIPREYINKKVSIVLEEEMQISKPRRIKRNNPRKGWGKYFKQMHNNGDDTLLLSGSNNFDFTEWKW